jgi:hypothetical protein
MVVIDVDAIHDRHRGKRLRFVVEERKKNCLWRNNGVVKVSAPMTREMEG